MKTLFVITSAAAVWMASLAVPTAVKPLTDREKVLARATTQIGVVEKTGRNDGKEVEAYLDSVNLDPNSRAPYCAAFVYWSGQALEKNPYPRSAWSPDMVQGGTRITETSTFKGGEAFGIYFPAKKRVAHTGLIVRREGSNIITIEGNTSSSAAFGSAADRDGQGVYQKRRPWRTVYNSRDWIGGAKK